tara:strand:- start:802 stop:1038 length:237 start_codon:yes stop_codon:yes gene_type:complete
MNWSELTQGISNDTLPENRDKYIKFSNLGNINKNMVIYYLKRGHKFADTRKACIAGILEEMDKDSDIRGYIESANGRK